MSRPAVGARAGAIASASVEEVRLLGYGVYEGDFVPDATTKGGLAKLAHKHNLPTPRIRLDDGTQVYGCQCYWGSEQEIKEIIGSRVVVQTTLEEVFSEEPESGDSSPA